MDDRIREQLLASAEVMHATALELLEPITRAAQLWLQTLQGGGLIAFCGNGGSAADAQHLATELVVRFRRDRRAGRALALTTDTSTLTAIGNDFGFEQVFARQVEGLMRPGDLLVVLSTSGNSPNCLAAVRQARQASITTLAFTGADGGQLQPLVDLCLPVPSPDTARVQETHITIGHILCDLVEAEWARDG